MFVNFYNCLNAAGTVLTDSIGTNNGTLAGTTLPTIHPNGYLYFPGGNGDPASSGRARVDLTKTDFQFNNTSAFTLIFKVRIDTTMPDNPVSGFIATFQRISTENNLGFIYYRSDLGFVIQLSTLTGGAKHKQYYNGADVVKGRIETVILSYNNNVFYVNINGVDKSSILKIDNTLNGNMYSANTKATMGAQAVASTTYNFDLKGDIFLYANKNDAMSIGQMKTYSAYMKGMV